MRLSKANLRPGKSWKGNLGVGTFGPSKVWRTNDGFASVNHSESKDSIDNQRNPYLKLTQIVPFFDLYSIKKQLIDLKFNSIVGTYWDLLQVSLSILACAVYVSETFIASYQAVQRYYIIEQVVTQFFVIDFFVSWIVSTRTVAYFLSPMTWVDLLTILPSYLSYFQNTPDFSALRFVRILRLIRILRTFRLLGGFSGVKRQMITIGLLIISLTFLAAGIYNICENEFNQLTYKCEYINKYTNYQPSCDTSRPTYDDPSCDCREHGCISRYYQSDRSGEPSLIKCQTIDFLESYYFTVVTIMSVGYGDFSPTNMFSRIVCLLYIATAFVMIPMQVNKLEQLVQMNSPYRTSYHARPHENHIILCGNVNDKQKLARLFREFFHPDRQIDHEIEINICILCPAEPTEEVKELISSPLFGDRVSYIIGSALNMEDLRKARCDLACAMFFLSNIEVDEEDALLDDAATVLRTLSVNNFNSNLDCYVQVLRSQERDLLKESNAELILCYDEYKTIIQARNSVCPGLATLVENLFNSFGSPKIPTSASKVTNEWLSEYSYGARMEFYYIPIDPHFFSLLGHSWALLVEAIYLEFECLLVGACSVSDYSLHYNPRQYERKKHKTVESYFERYSLGIIMAPNNSTASAIRYAMTDSLHVEKMVENLLNAENQFIIRRAPEEVANDKPNPPAGMFLSASSRALSASSRGFGSSRDLKALNTEDLITLKKIQNALETEFAVRRNLIFPGDASAVQSGMDSDSSEENDDDFLGYVEHVEEPIGTGTGRRVGIFDSSFSRSFIKSSSSDAPLGSDPDSAPTPTAPVQPTQVSPPRFTSPVNPPLAAYEGESLDALDQHQDAKGMRAPPGLVSLKSIQHMKRAASSRKMSSLKSFKSNIAKKNKTKSLKQAASLIKTVNKLNGGGGGFAALVKAAAAAEPTPDNLIAKPASIVTALTQTRATKQASKLSLLDAVRLQKVKEALVDPGTMPPIQQPVNAIVEEKTIPPKDEEKTIADEVAKFRAQKSFRRGLSTRTSTVMSGDKVEIVPVQISPKSDNESNPVLRSQNSLGDQTLKSQNSLGTTNAPLTRSQSRSLARSQSRGIAKKELSRVDSHVGEIVNLATIEKNSTIRKPSQLGGFGKVRRISVDSGMAALTNPGVMKGRPSEEIEDAAHLKNHIIVFGCMDHISIFVVELRKKIISDQDYRPILIVAPQEPRKWYQLRTKYNDVFLLLGTVTSAQDLILMNVREAHTLVLLSHRQAISVDEASNVDSESLFLYLTIEKLVPKNVFFTVELSRPNNMGVLNSVIIRRSKAEKTANQPKSHSSGIWGDDTVTGLSLKLRGSHKFRGSVDVGSMMNRLQSEKSMDEKNMIKFASRRANVFHVPDLSTAPTRSLSISSMISSNPALHSKNQAARRKIRANRKVHTVNFWDVDDTHHILPVFASGKAVCPTAFDSILCQSFFGVLTSQLCEKLICGQDTQTVFQLPIPKPFYGRRYVDLLRSCVSRCLLPLGLYRSPLPRNGAFLYYVFSNPPMETIIAGQDKIILFGNPQSAALAFQQFEIPLVRQDGKMALGVQVSASSFQERRKHSAVAPEKKPNPVTLAHAEYKPMGARHKPIHPEGNPTASAFPNQYVPRVAKIHPTLQSNPEIEKKSDSLESKQTANSTSSHTDFKAVPKSPKHDPSEEKVD